ncbi:hypothetical protein [Klebsiella pneumoniae]|uniref:hypothetical protein n=2 Tax=Klebsiella pneumoniae TaxID=573 RepID=UPI00129E10E0|nr:hypothetical protein [Klebsiella pneumoniae]QOU44136.1 hypothetical protein GJJ12_014440 [Klebsiella pneumoniae]
MCDLILQLSKSSIYSTKPFMAGKSLGTLTIDLVAKVGGFVSGMDKAERASAKWSKQVQDDVAKSSAALNSCA